MGQGHTIAEPVPEPEPRPDLVPCEDCVQGVVTIQRGRRQVTRRCRECSGTGFVLAANPVILDYRSGTYGPGGTP